MNPLISIIICTANRAESLRETLAAIGHCAVPADLPPELLVVDNASSDHTPQVARDASLPNMPVRYVREPRRGKGYAYNTGMAQANGEILLFTDDDVRPPVNWIDGMCRPIASGQADAIAGGVQIAKHLLRPWMENYHRRWFAASENLAQTFVEGLVGANMAFSRKVLAKVPEFDIELGPGALGFGDDSLFGIQIVKAGYRMIGAPDIRVEHHFDPGRLNRASLLRIAEAGGRSSAYIAYHWRHRDPLFPAVRLLRARLARFLHSCWATKHEDSASERDMLHAGRVAYWKMFLSERRRARNYPREGLVKISRQAEPIGALESVS